MIRLVTVLFGLRVLVTLKSDVLVDEESDGDGRQGYPWKIKGEEAPIPWDGTAVPDFSIGTGTETDPYMIETPEDLAYLASSVNGGTTYEGEYFALANDIDLGGVQDEDGYWSGPLWTPIGYGGLFAGNFNGNGYSISNINSNNSWGSYIGLFGHICGASVKNVVIGSGAVSGEAGCGGVAGVACNSELRNCVNYADISAQGYVGGIVGAYYNTEIIDCENYGRINAAAYFGEIYGGILESQL